MKGPVLSAWAADFCVLKETHSIRNFLRNATRCQKEIILKGKHNVSLNGGKERLWRDIIWNTLKDVRTYIISMSVKGRNRGFLSYHVPAIPMIQCLDLSFKHLVY